jgi:hypothetical protein
MTKALRANDMNLISCWKVRICMRKSGILFFISDTEPVVIYENGMLKELKMNCITNTEHGDVLGFLDLLEVSAITWRFAPLAKE